MRFRSRVVSRKTMFENKVVFCGATKTHGAITTTQMCGDCQHVPQYDFVQSVSEQKVWLGFATCLWRIEIHVVGSTWESELIQLFPSMLSCYPLGIAKLSHIFSVENSCHQSNT